MGALGTTLILTLPCYTMPERKLTPEQVLDIRRLLASGLKSTTIGKLLHVNEGVVLYIAKGQTYQDIQLDDNLYGWHVVEHEKIPRNYISTNSNHDSYCGFKLSSYALRRYGKKYLNAFIDSIAFCEHGDLCEECCFNYTGPESYQDRCQHNHFWLPTSLCGPPPLREPVHIAYEMTCNMRWQEDECIIRICKNLRCANIHHIEIAAGRLNANTRQSGKRKKTQSND